MNNRISVIRIIIGCLMLTLLTACAAAAPETPTLQPTSTQIPPTNTPIPPTATPVPPTDTPIPTETELPTETPIPPSPTSIPSPTPREYPQGRTDFGMAWDSESERVILVGGFLGSEPTNETWAYDPNAKKWIQMKPADMFEGLSNMSVAYDKESDRVIIFGGLEPWPPPYWVKNTWAYDYNTDTWTRLSKYGPSRRQDQRMVYDTESDRVILFGGAESTVSALSSREKFGDTWAYDFNTDTWQNMKPNPSPPERACFQMGYDIESDRVILWGGYGYKENDNRVWAYDYNTNTWKELRPFTDAPAQWGDMDYDIESDRMVLYGGSINGSTDTWTYDYNTDTWTAMAPNQAPGKLSHHRMAYITPLDQIILFGGMADQDRENPLDETWIYDLNSDTWETVILRQE